MATITYGWGDTIKKKQIMGYAWCPTCGAFKPRYISKLRFRVHISYIPVFIWPKGSVISCKGCKSYKEISKDEYKELRELFKPIKKGIAKKCFEEIKQICQPIMEYTPAIVEQVMMQVSQKYPVCANDTVKDFYSQLVTDVICSKLENMKAIQEMQNQQIEGTAVPAAATV